MRRSTSPHVPVVLSEMEIHWLITQHDQIIGEGTSPLPGTDKAWNEERRSVLLSAWDASQPAGPRAIRPPRPES
jgi:hypothetical protein